MYVLYPLFIVFCLLFKDAFGVSPCNNGSQPSLCKPGMIAKTRENKSLETISCRGDNQTFDNTTHACVHDKITPRNGSLHRYPNSHKLKNRACQKGWLTKAWRSKKLSTRNLKRRICRDNWFVYYLRVDDGARGPCVSIMVSEWSWKSIKLLQEVKHSADRIRRGELDVTLDKEEFKNKIVNGRFLIWSKFSHFDKYSIRCPRNIKYKIPKKYGKNARGIFERVARMCSHRHKAPGSVT